MNKQGFTLLEVLIATFILAILALAVTGIAVLGTRSAVANEQSVVAQGLVSAELERLRAVNYEDVSVGEEAKLIIQNDQSYEVRRVVTEVTNDPNKKGEDNYKNVALSVGFATPGGELRTTQTSTLIVPTPVAADALPEPVAHWTFDETSATAAAVDVTGNGHTGELTGPSGNQPAVGSGLNAGARFFDGVDDSFEVADTVLLNPANTNELTIVADFNSTSGRDENELIWWNAATDNSAWIRLSRARNSVGNHPYDGSAGVFFEVKFTDGTTRATRAVGIDGKYVGIVGRGTLRACNRNRCSNPDGNGTSKALAPIQSNPRIANGALQGYIKDLKIYNVALTDEQLERVLNEPT